MLVEDLDKSHHAMNDNADMVGKLHYRKLCPEFENGVLWPTGGPENWMQHILG